MTETRSSSPSEKDPSQGPAASAPSPTDVAGLRFFAFFTPAEVQSLLDHAAPCSFAAQTPIFAEGDAAGGMYVIVSGEVDIRRVVAGTSDTLATLRGGDVFGESDILHFEPARRMASALVTRECRALLFTHQQVEALCRTDAACGQRLYRLLGAINMSRLERMNEMYMELFVQHCGKAKVPALKAMMQQLAEEWGV